MKLEPNKGIVITQEEGTPLQSPPYFYWETECSSILRADAGDFCPDVVFQKGDNGEFQARFRSFTPSGTELCGTSVSLEDPNVRIPEKDLDAFIEALNSIHEKANDPNCTASARAFIQGLRVPDPQIMKSSWRVSTGLTRKLLVLWGYTAKDDISNTATVLPLTKASAKWQSSERRVDLRKRLENRLSSNKFNWMKFLRYVLCALLLLLLIALLTFASLRPNRIP